MKKFSLLLLFILGLGNAYAQTTTVSGIVHSKADTTSLSGATVIMVNTGTAATTGVTTDKDGHFKFERVAPGDYTIKINYLGFKPYTSGIQVKAQPIHIGVIRLEDATTTLQEVQVIGRVPLGEQKGDTIQFNAAAFKVAPDASAEDLVQKMPGITIKDGKIQAQGEDVQQILVDGKRFFGADAETALRNLPAEIIENIQIFDKKSDQAEFSGFDDGNRAKTINIVTKPNRRKGQFGKVAAGYGSDNRYMVGGSVNSFNGDRRFTVTGITNNINMQDFSIGEAPGGGMRGRRGGSSGGGGNIDQNGNMYTNSLSLNFNDKWGEKLEANGNYSYSRRQVTGIQARLRDFVSARDSGQVYTENSRNTNLNSNHHLNFRLDYKPNKTNRLLITPNISFQNGNSFSDRTGETMNNLALLNKSINSSESGSNSYNVSNNINYSHRFEKVGRVISSNFNSNYNTSNNNTFRLADNTFYSKTVRHELLDQFIDHDRSGYSWRGNIAFSEPIGDSSRLQLEYQLGNRVNISDRFTYNFVEQFGLYSALDTGLTNTFRNDYLTHELKTAYQYNTRKLRLQLEAQYQRATLDNIREFPSPFVMNRTFHSVLPAAQIEYRFTRTRFLRLEYRTNTDAPNVNQLQDVIDNSNALHIRTGNPDLKQSFQNRVVFRFNNFNPVTSKVFNVSLTGTLVQNGITNSTFRPDTTINLTDEIVLRKGSQLTRPVNINGNWNMNTSFNYGQPLRFLKSNFDVNGSINYARRPGMINNEINFSNSSNFRLGFTLSSNISENMDFNFRTSSSYNIVTNSIRPQMNNNFYNQSSSIRLNWTFLKGLVYRTELNHQQNMGLSRDFDNSFLLWNMSLSKKILKRQAGEISLSVNDLLEQNNNIRRNITDAYVEDIRSNVLQRFLLVTFSYNIRKFGGANAPTMNNGRQNMREGGGNRGGNPGRNN